MNVKIREIGEELVPELKRLQSTLMMAGGAGLVICAIGFVMNPAQFVRSFLPAYMWMLSMTLGSLALAMVHQVSGGAWGVVIRRILGAATRTLPLLTVLFIPIALGLHSLYPWADAAHVAEDPVLQWKQPYLNVPFFLVRAAIYFAVWNGIAYVLNKWSLEQDRTADNRYTRNMRLLAAPGMVALIFTVTFASVDWYMSLEPELFSTIYGFIYGAAWALSALAFVIAMMAWLSVSEPMKRIVAPLHFHDLGKLLLALVMLWSYFAFSQYLIIWSGNLPEEITWYLRRMHGGWGALIIAIGILHFAAPFLFLLSRSTKRNPRRLVWIAVLIIVMRMVDLLWMLAPAFDHGKWIVVDVLALIGFGGLWVALLAWQLGKRSLIPINDPQFESTLEQMHAGGH